jgi:hypothetical protein
VFAITAIVYLIGGIVLLISTKTELQEWASKKNKKEEIPLNKNDLSL